MESFFPLSANELSGEWISQVLLEEKVISSPIVSYTTDDQIVEGNSSTVFRLIPTYAQNNESQIKSLIVKFSSSNPGICAFLTNLRSYYKEIELYKEFNKTNAFPVSKCYYATVSEDYSKCIILLEDLANRKMSIASQKEGIPFSLLKRIIEQYSNFHSFYWNNIPETLKWINQNDFPLYLKGVTTNMFPKRKEGFIKKYEDILTPELISTINNLNIEDIYSATTREHNVTITHGDPHGLNVLFNNDEIIIIDWQLSSIGVGIKDVVLFIGISHQENISTEEIIDLKELYYNTLGPKVHETYDKKAFEEDWRNCSLVSLSNTISVSPEQNIGDDEKIKNRYSDYLSTAQIRFIRFLKLQKLYL